MVAQPPLLAFLLATALAPTRAEPSTLRADLVVAGSVRGLILTSRHVYSLSSDSVAVTDPEGRLVQRLSLPMNDSAGPRAGKQRAQLGADEKLFEKFAVPDVLRDTWFGERWVEDVRSAKDRPPADGPATAITNQQDREPTPWLLAASREKVFAASGAALWTIEGAHTFTFRRIASVRHAPSALAVSLQGVVMTVGPQGDFAVDTRTGAQQADACERLGPPADELVLLDVSGGNNACRSVIRIVRAGNVLSVVGPGHAERRLPLHARSLTSCGVYGLVNADEGLFAIANDPESGISTARLGSPAPYAQLSCQSAYPDAVVAFAPGGGGGSVSADAGVTWSPLPTLLAQPARTVASNGAFVWAATDIGLLRFSAADEAVAPARWQTQVWAKRRPSLAGLLPTLHVAGTWLSTSAQADGRQSNVAALVSAEFPLGEKTQPLRVDSRSVQPIPLALASSETGSHSGATRLPTAPPACLAAMRVAASNRALADPDHMQALIARARNAAWLPELRVRAEKRWGRNQSVDINNDTVLAPLGLDTVNDFRLEVRASWDLARLVYSPDELAAALAGVRVADAQHEIASLVNRLFFQRRKQAAGLALARAVNGRTAPTLVAPVDSSGSQLDDDSEGPLSERITELTADLDALTGGLGATCW